jgi:hypothetical protein
MRDPAGNGGRVFPPFFGAKLIRARIMPGLTCFPPRLTGFLKKPAGFRVKTDLFTTEKDDRIWQNTGGGTRGPVTCSTWGCPGGSPAGVPPAGPDQILLRVLPEG